MRIVHDGQRRATTKGNDPMLETTIEKRRVVHVVDRIKEVKIGDATLETKSGPDKSNTVPVENVIIKSVTRVEK